MALKAETGASRCRRYLLLPVQPLSQKTTYVFLGNVLSNFRSTPGAIVQQALSLPDSIELFRRQHGILSTYLPLRDVAVCPIVDKMRNFGRAHRVGRAFEKMIRVAVKTFSHLFKDTSFGKLMERPVARFMLGLILERECANFGATSISVARARLYIVRLGSLTRYLDRIYCIEEDMVQIINSLRVSHVFDLKGSGALIRQNNMSVVIYPWMREKIAFWSDRNNMKNLIADRIAVQSMTTDQAAASLPTGSPKAKRNITDTSDDHDKVSKEVDVDATDYGKTHAPEASGPVLKRFRDAPTQQQERVAMKEKAACRADDSGRSDPMKRSRD